MEPDSEPAGQPVEQPAGEPLKQPAGRPTGQPMGRLAALSTRQRELLLAKLRADLPPSAAGAPAKVPRDGKPLPASFLQERLWLADQILPGSSAYTQSMAIRLRGELDTGRLEQALALLVERHEVLRTSLRRHDGQIVQVVARHARTPLELVDLSADPAAHQAAERVLAELAATGFDLATPPLVRARLLRLAHRDHVLAIFLHHAVSDGWSNGLLLGELAQNYRELVAGRVPRPPEPRLQYGDAAAWQRARLTPERTEELLRHWTDRLSGAAETLDLPFDRPRTPGGRRRGATHLFTFPDELMAGAGRWARTENATMFMVILSAFAATLSRWSNQADVVVGSPRTGRVHPALEDVVGPFVNTVVLRLLVRGEATAAELLRQARQVTLDASDHADLPFERLVERLRPRRDPRYNPIFQVNFGLGNFPQHTLSLPWLTAEPFTVPEAAAAKFDLSLYVTESSGRWYATMEYNADLFERETIAQLADGLRGLLAEAVASPDAPVSTLPVTPLPTGRAAAAREPEARKGTGGHIPPRDRWERDVAEVWATVLGVDRIAARSDFFDLGGHSMAGMLVIDGLLRRTGRKITLATIFAHPTVEQLARALRAQEDDTTAYLGTLQARGHLPPLIFAHAAVGELAMYFNLARELGKDRPLYGLQPGGFFRDGRDPGDLTLRDMATRYAEELMTSHPATLYHLCGFSAAGRLALAVADRLRAEGRSVGAVVMLDTAPLGDVAPDPDLATILLRWLPFAPPRSCLDRMTRDEQIAATLAAGQRTGDLSRDLDLTRFGRFCRTLELNARALAGYRDPTYPGTATVFAKTAWEGRDIVAEWSGTAVGDLRAELLDVDSHLAFVEGPQVPLVARRLKQVLHEAENTERAGA